MESKFGVIMPNTKGNGAKIRLVEKENFGMQTEIISMASGKKTKPTATEFIYTQMGPNMKEIGKMTCKTVMELKLGKEMLSLTKLGLMVHAMKAIIKMERRRAWVTIFGAMALNTMVTGLTIKSRVLEYIAGLMEEYLKLKL